MNDNRLRDILERLYDQAWDCGRDNSTTATVGSEYCIKDVLIAETIQEIKNLP